MSEIKSLNKNELTELIDELSSKELDLNSWPFTESRKIRFKEYGNSVFLRGLIEFTSFCKQNCFYCGLRRDNKYAERFRLSDSQILECCKKGYDSRFRTFVLQGGEDPFFTDDRLCRIIFDIKNLYPDCAVTLSLGERSYSSYKILFQAGADRYLLRHETANAEHYQKLHPSEMKLESRKRSLCQLKEIGFQTGAGFMVGSPFQTNENLAEDLLFISELSPEMTGIGPFIPHERTSFFDHSAGTLDKTLLMLALTRIILPQVLLPSTTALGTIASDGREKGLMAGANVVMPNLSPDSARSAYNLYDGKLHTGAESLEGIAVLCDKIESVGLIPDFTRGDHVAAALNL